MPEKDAVDNKNQVFKNPSVNYKFKDSFPKDKNKLIAILIVLIAIPLTIILALTSQDNRNHAAGLDMSFVAINPGLVSANAEAAGNPVALSALAYDSEGNPINSGVDYQWTISSTDEVGSLTKTSGDISQFIPGSKTGCGQLVVVASYGGKTITKSAIIEIFNGSVHPNCEPSTMPTETPAPSPFITLAPTSTPFPTNTPTPTPLPSVQTMTIKSNSDAYVVSNQINKNFGNGLDLRTVSSPNSVIYLRFNLQPLAGKTIVKATLNLNVSDKTVNALTLRRAEDVSWSENKINYSNRPKSVATILTFYPGAVGSTSLIPVTGPVNLMRGRNLTFIISSSGTDLAAFYAREAGSKGPTLTVEYK